MVPYGRAGEWVVRLHHPHAALLQYVMLHTMPFNSTSEHDSRTVIMDALMIVFAMWIMNIFHPGRLLGPAPAWKDDSPVVVEDGARISEEQDDPEKK